MKVWNNSKDVGRARHGSVSVVFLWLFAVSFLATGSLACLVSEPQVCKCEFKATWTGGQWTDLLCEAITCSGQCYIGGDPPDMFCYCPGTGNMCKCWGTMKSPDDWPTCHEYSLSPCPDQYPDCREDYSPVEGQRVSYCECRSHN